MNLELRMKLVLLHLFVTGLPRCKERVSLAVKRVVDVTKMAMKVRGPSSAKRSPMNEALVVNQYSLAGDEMNWAGSAVVRAQTLSSQKAVVRSPEDSCLKLLVGGAPIA